MKVQIRILVLTSFQRLPHVSSAVEQIREVLLRHFAFVWFTVKLFTLKKKIIQLELLLAFNIFYFFWCLAKSFILLCPSVPPAGVPSVVPLEDL